MILSDSLIFKGKAALQAGWSDTATITREKAAGHTSDTIAFYSNIPCRLSQTSFPALDTSEMAAKTELTFILFLDAGVDILSGDTVTVSHNGQTFTGIAGLPFKRAFSTEVKLSGVKIS